MEGDVAPQIARTLNTTPEPPKHNYRTLIFILSFTIVLFVAIIGLLFGVFSNDYGYKTSLTPSEIDINEIISKEEGDTTSVKLNFENRLLQVTDLNIPNVAVCLEDTDDNRNPILLESTSTISKKEIFENEYKVVNSSETPLKMLPYSSVGITYELSGNWRDYSASYLEYDQINFIETDQVVNIKSCETAANDDESLGLITLNKDNCSVCVGSTGGADISIIDYVYNDDVIWRDGYISFVPIIKNVGDQAAQSFEVAYYLNGNFSKSFELESLQPGEIVNNFIAGTGFRGNFGVHKDLPMDLKLVITPLGWTDINPDNNEVVWDFDYVNSVLPKHTCSYTDYNTGSQDFYSASSITYNGEELRDLCVDDFYLLEYMCDNRASYNDDHGIEVYLYDCPEGCTSGACVRSSQREVIPIIEPFIPL